MPNYTLEVNQIEINGCNEKMFVDFFSIDSDFSENEEYFREDTIELGFKNEAERCSKELYDKHFSGGGYDGYIETLSTALEDASEFRVGDTQFILGNTTYTKQYDITAICIDDHSNEYIIVVSRLGY